MNLTPAGNQREMKGQMVRPTFRTDLSPLLKIVEAQRAAAMKTAQSQTAPFPRQQEGQQQKPEARPTVEQEQVDLGGGPNAPAKAQAAPAGPASQQQGAQPPAAIPKAQDPVNNQPDPAQAKAQARSTSLKLYNEFKNMAHEHGLPFEGRIGGDSLTVTMNVPPHVQAEDDGQFYPADQVMQPIIEWAAQRNAEMTLPTPAQAHRRIVDPQAKPITYTFVFKPQGEQGKDNQQKAITVPHAPKGGKPLPSRPNSKMGVPPMGQDEKAQPNQNPQKEAFGLGSGLNTLPELIASKKDQLVEALLKLLKEK